RGTRLVSEMNLTATNLRRGEFEDAGERQRRHAKELKDLAAALRTPPADRVAALKAAAEKVARAIDAQQKVNNDTKEKVTPEEADKARKSGFDPKVVKGNEVANQQTKAEFATRDARKAAEQAAPEVADLLKPAENNQWKSEDALRKGDTKAAQEPQDKALDDLKAAKQELDRQIAAAELAKTDPLAADKQQALKNLEDAKKALDQQAQAIEQRRADIAKLEELKNKLEELAKNEKDVAKDANKAAADPKKPETGEIAKKQDDLTPPTKDV